MQNGCVTPSTSPFLEIIYMEPLGDSMS